MTEEEWLACEEPWRLLIQAGHQRRKLGLWQVACCRRLAGHLRSKWLQQALTLAERYAEGEVGADALVPYTRAEWTDYCEKTKLRLLPAELTAADAVLWTVAGAGHSPTIISSYVLDALRFATNVAERTVVVETEAKLHVSLFRDVFGNPFRLVALDPTWLTSDVLALASQMYELREFSAMPILADALQDAGCTNEDVLTHCRTAGEHVRGCWVLDLVLGKE